MPSDTCLLCRPGDADHELQRVEVWQDELWRVTVSLVAPVLGFAYLEPKRHIPHITDLNGPEATTLGGTLAHVTNALKGVAGADLVYVAVFGDRHAHLHFNLAPHRTGDVLTGGAGLARPGAEPLDAHDLRTASERIRSTLAR